MSNSRGKSLAKNTLILTVGKISTQAITFLLLPLYTAYLSREDYGVVDLISTIVALLIPILNVQIEQAVFRYMVVNRQNKEELKRIISSAFSFVFIQIILVTTIFLVIHPFIQNQYKWFLLINLVIGILNFSLMQVMRGLGDNIGYATSAFIVSLVNICVNLLLILVFNLGATALLSATAIGGLVSILFILIRSNFSKYYSLKLFDQKCLKELLLYSFPLVPNELSWWAIRASDRLVVTVALGAGTNGIVAIAHKFPSVFIMFYNIFGIAWTESVVLHLKEDGGEKFFSDMTNRMLRIFSSLVLMLIALMPFIFTILINDNFKDAYYLIPLYMIGCVFNVVIGLVSTVYIVHKQTKVIAKTSILAAIICLLIDVLLVKYIGIYASPVSNILGFGVMMIYRCYDIKRYVLIMWNIKYILIFLSIFIITILGYYLENTVICSVIFMFVSLFVYMVNKNDILFVLKSIRTKLTSRLC